MSDELPRHGRLAGVDYGRVRIGFAISDFDRTLASPLENYTRKNEQADADWIRNLVRVEQIVGFVVGLPIHASGDESEKSGEARKFGAWLSRVAGLAVVFHDERFSTVAADQILGQARFTSKQRKKRRDMLAAQVILSSFLESRFRGNSAPGPLEDT